MWLIGVIVLALVLIFFIIAAWKTYDIAIRTTPIAKEKYRQRSRQENSTQFLNWYDQQNWQVWQQQSEDQLTLKANFLAGEVDQPVAIIAHGLSPHPPTNGQVCTTVPKIRLSSVTSRQSRARC
ncbi:MAG: hypothetical protein LKE89_05510 [Lactobacillaceae bacterium]|nr:hypothetical protein [Lactobacillaceae bacterium]